MFPNWLSLEKMDLKSRRKTPANDAQLIQLVRTRFGRENVKERVNVSSCGLVVTLHGMVESTGERSRLETLVKGTPGVEDVINKLGIRRAE